MPTIKPLRNFLSLGLLLTLILFLPSAAAAQGEAAQVHITQVDTSRFPQVTVYISVTNAAGEPVNVDARTIQIFENGQPMQPTEMSAASGDIGILTTMLVIDVSGSMEKSNKMQAAKDAATAYVLQMRAGDQAGVIAYNTQANYVQPITTDRKALDQAIEGLQPGGDTAMFDALMQAAQTLEGIPDGRKAIIVLTDGLDNRSQSSADDVIAAIGPSGLSISTIGLGDPAEGLTNYGLDEPTLRSLAERAGGVYSFAADPGALTAIFELYSRALQSEYRITYISPSPLRDGVNRSLSVSLVAPGGEVVGESKYNPGGVVPEVSGRSWLLFGGILGGLLLLLLIPLGIGSVSRMIGGGRRKGRVKLSQPASSKKARIKLK